MKNDSNPTDDMRETEKRVADACGEVPTPELVAYNIDRLRAIGYLDRFDGYLRQLGFDADARNLVRTSSRREILNLAKIAGGESWAANPESHLDETDCGTVLVVTDTPGDSLHVAPFNYEELLEKYESLKNRVLVLLGIDPRSGGSLDRAVAFSAHPAAGGFAVSPFLAGIPLSDDLYRPTLRTAMELNVPIWVHSSAHFRTDVEYNIGHPLHVDRVLKSYPGLRIIIGHAGWPWVDEACIVAVRHPSTAIEFSTFPPRLINESGWSLSPLLANRSSLRGRIFFGSGGTSSSRRMSQLLREIDELDIGDDCALWRGEGLLSWLDAN